MIQQQNQLVILGCGYTGRFLYHLAMARHQVVRVTSRRPEQQLTELPSIHCLAFDIEQPETWANIPVQANLIWCFPAVPLDRVQLFAKSRIVPSGRLVVLGSTSAYDETHASQDYPPPWIDESTLIEQTKPRVQGEEWLRNELNAIVLRVAGIYGPGRNPLDWIRQGRVSPSPKYVNLVHAEDLAAVCLLALEKGTPGEVYNVSDGHPHTWDEICLTAQMRWGVTAPTATQALSTGRRISNAKIRVELGYEIQHSDLYSALDLIESTRSQS
jgi:nucleoside-diphosphate-sugar epimerase